jgi:hypothetical protein
MTDLPPSDTASRLLDIRLRIHNRERITPAEMRSILLDIARDRENAAKYAARDKRAAKRAASGATPAPSLNLDEMFKV